jgi:hypothetical protein
MPFVTGALLVLSLTAVFDSAVANTARAWAELAGVTLTGVVLGLSVRRWAFPVTFVLWATLMASLGVTGHLHDSDTTVGGLVVLDAIVLLTPAWLGATAGLLLRKAVVALRHLPAQPSPPKTGS